MGIWKDKVRKDWRYEFSHRGERYAGGGFKTRREAVSGREKRREEVKVVSKPTPNVMGFREAASTYLDYAERQFDKGVYLYKKFVYKSFLDHHGDMPIFDVTAHHIDIYCATRPSAHNYNIHRKELGCLFNYLINIVGLKLTNPCAKLPKRAEDEKKKQIPTPEELDRMMAVLRPGDEYDTFILCLHLAGRIDEILRLTWDDVNFDKRTVTLWTRKKKGGLKRDDLGMSDQVYAILKRRSKSKAHQKWVFLNTNENNPDHTPDRYMSKPKMMESICKRAGIAPIGKGRRKLSRGKRKGEYVEHDLYYGLHTLRHYTVDVLANKEDIVTASKYARHTNMSTTQKYVHPSDKNMQAAVKQINSFFTSKKQNPQASPTSIKRKRVTQSA